MDSDEATDSEDGWRSFYQTLLFLDDFDPKFMAVGILVFFAISWCLAALAFLLFGVLPRYRDLRKKSRWLLANWAVKAIVSTSELWLSVYHMFSNELAGEDIVTGKVPTGGLFAVMIAGYHYFDLSVLLMLPSDSVNLLHHIGSVVMSSFMCMCGKPRVLFLKFLMVDIVVPVVFIRLVLDYGGMKYSKVWRMCMYFAIHTYHIRNLVEIYVWIHIVSNWQAIWGQLPAAFVIALCYHLAYLTFYYTPHIWHKYTMILYESDSRTCNNRPDGKREDQLAQDVSKSQVKDGAKKE